MLIIQMSEINRTLKICRDKASENTFRQVNKKDIMIDKHLQAGNRRQKQAQYEQYVMELPITHNQTINRNISRNKGSLDTDKKQQLLMNLQCSGQQSQMLSQYLNPTDRSQSQLSQKCNSMAEQQIQQVNRIGRVLSQVYVKYKLILQLVSNINNTAGQQRTNRASNIEICIDQLYKLHRICIEQQIELTPRVAQQIIANMSRRNLNKREQWAMATNNRERRNNQENSLIDQLDWFILFINITLNLWKLLTLHKQSVNASQSGNNLINSNAKINFNQKKNNMGKSASLPPLLQIVRSSYIKLLSVLKIPIEDKPVYNQATMAGDVNRSTNRNDKVDVKMILPNEVINRLILLLVIYSKQQLMQGNPKQALRICNICSYHIIYNNSSTNSINPNKIQITRQNKFKLHYLRVKIFNQLRMQRQQLQQINICEKLVNQLPSGATKDSSNNLGKHKSIHKTMDRNADKSMNKSIDIANLRNKDSIQIIRKLQERKKQILQSLKGLIKNEKTQLSLQKPRHQSSHQYEDINNSYGQRQKTISSVYSTANLKISNENMSSNSFGGSKLKQVRDSLQINDRNYEQNHGKGHTLIPISNKEKFVNRIRSASSNNLRKLSANKCRATNLNTMSKKIIEQVNNQLQNCYQYSQANSSQKCIDMFKQTYKASFPIKNAQQFMQSKNNLEYQFKQTVKFQSNHIYRENNQKKSQIKSKELQSYKNPIKKAQNIYNSKQIKDKYQLKVKRLTKKPIKLNNKSRQYEGALLALEVETENHTGQVNSKQFYGTGTNYMDLLVKRPTNKLTVCDSLASKYEQSDISKNKNNYAGNSSGLNFQKRTQLEDHQNENNGEKDKFSKKNNKLKQNFVEKSVSLLQNQILEKYIQKKYVNKYQNKKKSSQPHSDANLEGQDSQCDSFTSEDSQPNLKQGQGQRLKNKQKTNQQKNNQIKTSDLNQYSYVDQQAQSTINIIIENVIFPGLGKCDKIQVNIKKEKNNLNHNDQQDHQSLFYIMKLNIICQLGTFVLVHPMDDRIFDPSLSINQILKQKLIANVLTIKIKGQEIKTDEQQIYTKKQNIILKKKILQYIKTNIILSNKGLGLRLETKKMPRNNQAMLDYIKKNQDKNQNLFNKISQFNKIYVQNKKCLPYIFSNDNKNSIEPFQYISLIEQKNQQQKNIMNNHQNKEDRLSLSVMETLKVLYVIIQKKSKSRSQKKKKTKINKKIKQSKQRKQNAKKQDNLKCSKNQNISTEQKRSNIDNRTNKQQVKQQVEQKQRKDKIQIQLNSGCQQHKKQHEIKNYSQQFKNSQIDNFLVPVVKYILMGQTSKPKHKLKTIIIRARQNQHSLLNHNTSLYSSDEQNSQNQNEFQRNRKQRNCRASRYGLLTQYIDDESTIKIKPIFTNIYEQTIGKYFMGIDKRKDANLYKKSHIPEDVMLSLKCYLMISSQYKQYKPKRQHMIPSLLRQNQTKKRILKVESVMDALPVASNSINIIDRFYQKFQYSFITNLGKSQKLSRKKQNYLVTATFFRVRKLYRQGFQKFYLIKLQINQRNTRTRMDQFIMTSIDLYKHFNGLQLDLHDLQAKFSIRQDTQPIQTKQNKQIPQVMQNRLNKERSILLKRQQNNTVNENNDEISDENKTMIIQNNMMNVIKQQKNQKSEDKKQQSKSCINQEKSEQKIKQEIQKHKQNKNKKVVETLQNINIEPNNNELDYKIEQKKQLSKCSKLTQSFELNQNKEKAISSNTRSAHVISNYYADVGDKVLKRERTESQNKYSEHTQSINQMKQNPISNTINQFNNSKDNQSQNQINNQPLSQKITQNNLSEFNLNRGNYNNQSLSQQLSLQKQVNHLEIDSIISPNDPFCKRKYRGKNCMANFNSNQNQDKYEVSKSDQKSKDSYQNVKMSIANSLKLITQRISIFKTQVYTRVGIESLPCNRPTHQKISSQFNLNSKANFDQIVYYANRFRFSRNKWQQFSQKFLSSHLKNLQVIFQKTIKIQCYKIFAILTVLKIKQSSEFHIKIYLPFNQKSLSFAINCSVFHYFTNEQLSQIFHQCIEFDFQRHKQQNNQSKKQEQIKNLKNKTDINLKPQNHQEKIDKQKNRKFSNLSASIRKFSRVSSFSLSHQQKERQEFQKYRVEELKYMVKQIQKYFCDFYMPNTKQYTFNPKNQISVIKCDQMKNRPKKLSTFKKETDENDNNTRIDEKRYGNKSFNEVSEEKKLKMIWNKIIKFLSFETRLSSIKFSNEQIRQINNPRKNNLYLIAKIGKFQAFIKDFSVQQFINLQKPNKQQCIFKIQVSMQQKLDGLNFNTKNKHTQALKRKSKSKYKRNRKGKNDQRDLQNKIKDELRKQYNIYQSETNKHIIYISLSNTMTEQKLCYSYYLCQLLHLIDYNELRSKHKSKQVVTDTQINDTKFISNDQQNNYRIQSKQFNQIILNYAVLYKILNYIKNQYIIQLQNNESTYVDNIWKFNHIKSILKRNVDKILLLQDKSKLRENCDQLTRADKQNIKSNNQNNKQRSSIISSHNLDDFKTQQNNFNEQNTQNILNKLFKNLLNSTFNIEERGTKNDIKKMQIDEQKVYKEQFSSIEKNGKQDKSLQKKIRQNLKMTFNGKINNQRHKQLSFLVRKVVGRKQHPISCMFFDQKQNKFKIYISNYTKGTIKSIQIQLQKHPLPFIDIISKNRSQHILNRYRKSISINQQSQPLNSRQNERHQRDNHDLLKAEMERGIGLNSQQINGHGTEPLIHQHEERRQKDFLLAFRGRLLKYHRNIILLASL